jgi:cell wall-associated NlpC family hydrolase
MRTALRVFSLALAAIVVAGIFVGKASASTPRRYTAMHFALGQEGKPYRYGATGPSSYDCSGLVIKAYAHAGISLPRTADAQLHSSKAQRIAKKSAHWGDLMFWVSGGHASHVEFVTTRSNVSFGAHHSGTRIGYRGTYGSPVYVHIRGAG